MGTQRAEDGTFLSFSLYEASDGERVKAVHGEFSSDDRAAKHLEVEVKKAKRIIERGVLRDDNGVVVGERAVVNVPLERADKTEVQIILTRGCKFQLISSGSYRDALALEKQLD